MKCIHCFEDVNLPDGALASDTYVCSACGFETVVGQLFFIARLLAMPPAPYLGQEMIGSGVHETSRAVYG